MYDWGYEYPVTVIVIVIFIFIFIVIVFVIVIVIVVICWAPVYRESPVRGTAQHTLPFKSLKRSTPMTEFLVASKFPSTFKLKAKRRTLYSKRF